MANNSNINLDEIFDNNIDKEISSENSGKCPYPTLISATLAVTFTGDSTDEAAKEFFMDDIGEMARALSENGDKEVVLSIGTQNSVYKNGEKIDSYCVIRRNRNIDTTDRQCFGTSHAKDVTDD